MQKIFIATTAVFWGLSASSFAAAPMDLNDFLPPAQGGPSSPTGPIEKKDDVISAPNMQDAMASAFKQLNDEGGVGVQIVATKTGMGILAAATANYKPYDNPNATNLSKRGAYFRAFTEARKELVSHMEGIKNKCSTAVRDKMLTLDTGKDSAANSSSNISDVCGEEVMGEIAAYIVYSVNDNIKDKSITMALASTTKTRGAVDRIGGAIVTSDDPQAAWKDIISEVTNYATPPMGAKMIVNQRNNETIIIGFGSAIIRQNADAAIGRELKKTAVNQSQIRARNALVSFLKGDSVYWSGGFDEKQMESSEQFAIPVDENNKPKDPVVFDKTRDSFLNTVHASNDYKIVTEGQLPPGVTTKSFQSEDGIWQFSLAVYMPSATEAAMQAGAENRDAINRGNQSSEPVSQLPSGHTLQQYGGANEQAPNSRGPSGQVSPKHDF